MENRLELYRRHTEDCPHADKGAGYTKCTCPIWCDGYLNSRRYRKSLKLRDWARATKRIEQIEAKPEEQAAAPAKTIRAACDAYLADSEARNLAENTLRHYRNIFNQFVAYCSARLITEPAHVDLDLLTAYRADRNLKSSAQRSEIRVLRSWFAFCQARKWADENPAKNLTMPKEDSEPTLPYTPAEVEQLIQATGEIRHNWEEAAEFGRVRARAIVLLLLYSGLRISDAAMLERSRLQPDGRLLLRAIKNKVPVYVRLPQSAVDALHALPATSPYFFWTGQSKRGTIVSSLSRTIYVLARMTGIAAHPHRFRDTFAVRLLEKGVPVKTVQTLLGHSSIRTTEKHYLPYMSSHQQMLDDAVALLDFEAKAAPRTRRGKLQLHSRESAA